MANQDHDTVEFSAAVYEFARLVAQGEEDDLLQRCLELKTMANQEPNTVEFFAAVYEFARCVAQGENGSLLQQYLDSRNLTRFPPGTFVDWRPDRSLPFPEHGLAKPKTLARQMTPDQSVESSAAVYEFARFMAQGVEDDLLQQYLDSRTLPRFPARALIDWRP